MTLNNDENDRMVAIEDDLRNQVKLVYTSFEIRILHKLIGLICVSVISSFTTIVLHKAIPFYLSMWLLVSVLYLFLFRGRICRTRRCLENLHFSYYFIGILMASMLVYYMGGVGWIAILFYGFDTIYGNVLLSRLRGALITMFIALCLFPMMIMEYKGIIPQQNTYILTGQLHNNSYILTLNVIVMGALMVLVSYSTGLFSKMKYDRERSLIESKNRFRTKSNQLEDIAQVLRKKVAENKYIKRAAMGYIEKKEYEIEITKKDLESQIEKLRKTHKSMYFMIEDLNEMSTQLKDARDNLEEKVKIRTDELLKISRKLHRSERLAFLGKLAGSVTHELRNPLAVLKNASYYMKKKLKKDTDEKIIKYVDIMKKEISLIDSIIDDIMGFAKTRAPEFEEADLGKLIDNTLSTINVPELIEIKKVFEKVPTVEIDIDQIMHAVINITNNAIMAMSGHGKLTFRLFKKDKYVCLEIADTGPGIPPEQRELIFEPLYSSKPKGTGLGLPIAKMMVENQNGKIEFESELGEGTVFSILLPIERKV